MARKKYIISKEQGKEYRRRRKEKLALLPAEELQRIKEKKAAYHREYHQKHKPERPEVEYIPSVDGIPIYKVCSRCEEKKESDCFRIREEKRYTPVFRYLNNICKQCEREKKRIYDRGNKVNHREKNNQKSKEYYHKNKEVIKTKMKDYRRKPESKEKRKEYYERNRDRIREQHRMICKRAVIELRDWYIIGRLVGKTPGIRSVVKDENLIELKRTQITLIRAIKDGIKKD